MPTAHLVRRTTIANTFRVAKVQGMFDIPACRESVFEKTANLPFEERDWNLGLIVGSSGSGKTTLAAELFPETPPRPWVSDSILDDFPEHMTPTEITNLLCSVGLSSSPKWLLPYRALSTGQQFRADLARALAADDEIAVVDEFTSTVDRTVAKAACVAVSKHVHRTGRKLVAVTCHRDVEAWLQPDWVFDTDTFEFTWGSVQPRPRVKVFIEEGSRTAWPRFRDHHYLSGELSPAARVFLAWATLGNESDTLVGFFSIISSIGHKGWRRGHRTVVLPDYQGLGIGNRMIEAVAEQLWQRERLRFGARTSAPAIVHHRLKHPDMWRLVQAPKMKGKSGRTGIHTRSGKPVTTSAGRLGTSWAYIPESLRRH